MLSSQFLVEDHMTQQQLSSHYDLGCSRLKITYSFVILLIKTRYSSCLLYFIQEILGAQYLLTKNILQ